MAAKKKENPPKRIWTRDREELASVDDTRESIQTIDAKGKIKGGREYFGFPLTK